jgi:hypothetical protein
MVLWCYSDHLFGLVMIVLLNGLSFRAVSSLLLLQESSIQLNSSIFPEVIRVQSSNSKKVIALMRSHPVQAPSAEQSSLQCTT